MYTYIGCYCICMTVIITTAYIFNCCMLCDHDTIVYLQGQSSKERLVS